MKLILLVPACIALASCDRIQHTDSSASSPTPAATKPPQTIADQSAEHAAIVEMEAERTVTPKDSASPSAIPSPATRTMGNDARPASP